MKQRRQGKIDWISGSLLSKKQGLHCKRTGKEGMENRERGEKGPKGGLSLRTVVSIKQNRAEQIRAETEQNRTEQSKVNYYLCEKDGWMDVSHVHCMSLESSPWTI
mgnify:CR=1 FL=1